MNKTKKILAILLSAVMCLAALTACSKSPVESEPSNSGETATKGDTVTDVPKTEEVTINFWHHYSAQSAENSTLMNVLIPKFQEENPGVKVNAVSHEWADLHDKILVSAQSDQLPDVARLDAAWIPEFQAAGILTSLDEKIPEFGSVSQTLLDSAMSTAKIGDHYYGLALNTNTKILFYNVKAFKDAGLNPPTTMEEFINDAKKLSGTNENSQQIWGYDEPALAGWNLCPFIWSYGGDLLNPEQTKASGYINSAKTVAAVQMFADLYKEKAITGWNSGDIPMTDGFGTGRFRMILEGPWKIAEMAGSYPDFEYATASMPAGDGGSVSVLGGEDISLFNTSGDDAAKEAAWNFAKFMTGEFAQTEMAKCGQIPVNKTALESDTVKNSDFAPFLEAIKTAKSRPTVSCWSEIDTELSAAVTSVVNGEKTAQEAMDALAVKVDGLLAGK
ncbi:extracellular solute-binding protein [Anaerocolumna xylanovorans]|uniref:Multiple sugar transport system substrate-binding protein n=1 Tax=Anaerocolumna xylanovorans DSM 12503 TaxID=1121345 RepID=A0A1M7Y9H5_9FIRM|nr:extracellular solute-binding protein [Anaerocolumna xylanovorans]SHO49284.1 multiple sugar transport system substrate-binding protein [Anaerocolumna xylanovorans DSM 12503]